MHWAIANRQKKAFWRELDKRCAACWGVPKPPAKPLERAIAHAHWYAERAQWAPDKENITRRLKPAIDWLVTNGYLVNDSHDRLSWADHNVTVGPPPHELCTVVLTLTPIVK